MSEVYSIDEIRSRITPLARRYGARRIYLFGSYARGDAQEGSDLDLRIDKGEIRGLALAGLLVDIEDNFKIAVDLLTTESLEPDFLERIGKEEVLLYEAE